MNQRQEAKQEATITTSIEYTIFELIAFFRIQRSSEVR